MCKLFTTHMLFAYNVLNILPSVRKQPFLASKNLTLASLSKLVALSRRFSTFKTLRTTLHSTA